MARSRRILPIGIVAGVAVLAAAWLPQAAQASSATPAPWLQASANGAYSSFNPDETLVSAASVASLTWTHSFTARPVDPNGLGCGAGVATSPVTAGNRMYVVLSQRLLAFDLTSGAKVWSQPLDVQYWATYYTSLTIVGGRVVLTSEDCESQSDPSGAITAFRASDGAQLWRTWVDPGPLYAAVSGNTLVYSGFEAGGGDVAAIDLTDGSSTWTDWLPCWGPGRILVVGGLAIVSACRPTDANVARLEAHNLTTGAVVWARSGDWQVYRGDTDAASGHDVYVANPAGRLVDLNPLTGAPRWSLPNANGVEAVARSYLYTYCATDTLCALSRATGATVWTQAVNPGPVAVANGLVLIGGAWDSPLLAKDGSPVSIGLAGAAWTDDQSTVAVANGRVITSSRRIVDVYQVPGA
jgi:outer membrane protein assembly factor BamB